MPVAKGELWSRPPPWARAASSSRATSCAGDASQRALEAVTVAEDRGKPQPRDGESHASASIRYQPGLRGWRQTADALEAQPTAHRN